MFQDATILLIDDDTWMQRVLSKIISRLEIRNIHSATDGFTGINLAIEKNPNAIFLDLIMPNVDGLVTLKMLKAINLTKDIPVIIITSNSDFENVGSVLAAGASEFVAKPFSFATIQEKLIKVLSNAQVKTPKNKSENYHTFDNLGLENDDIDFFNSFSIEGEIDNFYNKEEPTPRMSYKNIGNAYKETTENEINKILKN